MSYPRRIRSAAALLLAVSLSLSACTPGSNDAAGPGAASLTFAGYEPDHLTPANNQMATYQVQALFSSLTYADQDGKLSMLAADSVTSLDGINWTIKLKSGWTFHDGSSVTAQDYVDSWNAVAYGPNAWAYNGNMSNIAGYADLNPAEGQPTTKTMSGLKVVDDTTFTVTLSKADGQFPVQLTQNMFAFYPMPAVAFADPAAYDRMPIGNGPYKMTKPWQANEPITVTAYEQFAGEKPGVKEFVFKPYLDMGAAYTDAQAGNIDLMFVPQDKTAVAATDFPERLHRVELPGESYLAFPANDPRYADKRVRQAFSMAIDREAVNKAVFSGLNKPATAFTVAWLPGTPEGVCGEFCKFDPQAAKALLAEAGGFSGKVELVYPGGIGLDTEYQAYANQLRQNLGLEDVTVAPTTGFADFSTARTKGEMKGPFFSYWGAPYPSQQNTLREMFTAKGLCAGCALPLDPRVATAIDAANTELDQEAAKRGYAKAQELIAETFPVAPLFDNSGDFYTSEKIAELPFAGGYTVVARIKGTS